LCSITPSIYKSIKEIKNMFENKNKEKLEIFKSILESVDA